MAAAVVARCGEMVRGWAVAVWAAADLVAAAGVAEAVAAASRVAAAVSAVAEREGNGDAIPHFSMSLFSSIPPIEDARVVAAIAAAEARTSGEIRVFISSAKTETPLVEAEKQFERMNMTQTAARNGVLIFLAPASHTFAVVGDKGVHEICGSSFWQELATAMNEHFKRADFTQGLVLGIERAGALLAEFFPRKPDDRDELPNQVERPIS
jgi:uncharacterized membrane protein